MLGSNLVSFGLGVGELPSSGTWSRGRASPAPGRRSARCRGLQGSAVARDAACACTLKRWPGLVDAASLPLQRARECPCRFHSRAPKRVAVGGRLGANVHGHHVVTRCGSPGSTSTVEKYWLSSSANCVRRISVMSNGSLLLIAHVAADRARHRSRPARWWWFQSGSGSPVSSSRVMLAVWFGGSTTSSFFAELGVEVAVIRGGALQVALRPCSYAAWFSRLPGRAAAGRRAGAGEQDVAGAGAENVHVNADRAAPVAPGRRSR